MSQVAMSVDYVEGFFGATLTSKVIMHKAGKIQLSSCWAGAEIAAAVE